MHLHKLTLQLHCPLLSLATLLFFSPLVSGSDIEDMENWRICKDKLGASKSVNQGNVYFATDDYNNAIKPKLIS